MSSNIAFNKVMDSRKELVDNLIKNLEKGYLFSPESWNGAAFRPHNPVSNAFYNGGNRFKLMFIEKVNEYNDPRWVTFKQAQSMDWKIKKDAKGVLLEKWIFTKEKILKDENGKIVKDKDGKAVKETVKLDKPIANYFIVFNATQVDGIPPLEPLKPLTHDETLKLADNIINSSECPITETIEGSAYYSPTKDTITLPLRDSFKSTDAFLHVLLHEMAHSTGHETRLNRDILNTFGSEKYAAEELNAEISSYFLRSDLGIKIDKDTELLQDHSNYINSWIKVLNDDPNALYRACKEADKISSYLYKNYENHLTNEKSYEISLEASLKENGFKATKGILNSIHKLNNVTGKKHSLTDLKEAYKNNIFKDNPEADKLIKSIGNSFKKQELMLIEKLDLCI